MKRTVVTALLTSFLLIGLVYPVQAENQSVQLNSEPTGMTMISQDQGGVMLEINIGEVEFFDVGTKDGMFTSIRADGLSRSYDIGNPDLPMANRLLAIPFGCDIITHVLDYETVEIDLKEIGVVNPIMPAQPSLSKSDDPGSVPFEINLDTYNTPAYYQTSPSSSEILGVMRNLRIGRVSASPFEYNPVENRLKVYTKMTVQVTFKNPDWELTNEMRTKFYSPVFEPIMAQLANYESFSGSRNDSLDLRKYPIKYLVISDRMFESQLVPFIEWKTQKGFTVEVAYTDDIGSSNSAISSYIESVYNAGTPTDPAPSFVLLVGDAQEIPPFSGTAGSHVTDLYFCEFTNDLLPEIYYGRFSAHTTAELQPQIDKTLEYEKYEMPDPSYLAEVTLVSGVDGSYAPTYGNGQINYGTTYYFNAAHGITPNVWLYPASDASGAAADIIQTVSDGVSFYNYTAHCSHAGHADPPFETSDIPGLTNYHQYLLGIGNCCLANTFGTDYSNDCFGEAFLKVADKGGIGYIGASNSTYWDEDYFWGCGYGPVVGSGPTYEQTTLGAYDGVFHDQANEAGNHSRYYVTNDAIVFAGNLGVSASSSSRKAYYWEAYHLMGDPSCMTYLGIPPTNNITMASTVLMTSTTFTVDADPGSLVGISVNGVLHGSGYIDESGTVDIDLTEFAAPGTADIVITAQNRQPYIGTIQIVAPNGPFVIYDDYTLNDGSGNNDGIANCGESIVLDMQLENVGPDTAYSVSATISSSDTFVTITDDNEYFGEIPGDFGVLNMIGAFAFDIAGNCPDGHEIAFDLAVTGSETKDTTWTSAFKVPVSSPNLGFVSMTIDDATGNDNGILDPGETANLTITIGNDGSADALTVNAVVSESDTHLSFSDNEAYYGDITSGLSADNGGDLLTVSADASCPLGYLVQLTIDVTGAGGYGASLTCNITVGDRVVFFADDFSFDQGWTGLGGSGEWTIGPAVGGSGSDGNGGPDPSEDHSPSSDNYVLGTDLTSGSGGDYNSGLSTTYWVTSPLFDLSGFSGVEMRFWRWLGIESSSYDHAYFQVYNGSSWVTLYESGSTSDDQAWLEQYYDLGEYADGNQDFQFRFGIGSTDGSVQYCGWNIDDIELKGYGQIQSGSPGMVCNPTAVFDSLHLGDTHVDTVVVKNDGEVLLRARLSTADAWLSVDTSQQSIAAGDSVLIPVTVNTSELTPGDFTGSVSYSCNDPENPYGDITVNLHIYSPDIVVAASSITETALIDEIKSQPLIITNEGPGRLEYDISRLMFNGKTLIVAKTAETRLPIGYRQADPDKGQNNMTEPYFAPMTKGSGGPDTWGYNWVDSDEEGGPTYGWIDISTVGTAVTLGDDDTTSAIPIGFSFPFYNNYYDDLYIGSNGIIGFGDPIRTRTNTILPNGSLPNNLLAIWWDDLDPRKGGNIYYYNDTENDQFIVTYDSIPFYYSTTGTGGLTFQAILKANGQILLQYNTMDSGSYNYGLRGATVGIENETGDDGLTVVFNADYMHDNLAVQITAASWLSVTPANGSIDPFSADTVDVGFDATGMSPGDYNGQILIGSNDPDTPEIDLPVTFTVESEATAPVPPVLVSPADGATDVALPVTLDWDEVTSADLYKVQITTDPTFATAYMDSSMIETSCDVDGLPQGVMHYWRAAAHNSIGWGNWSEVGSFTTAISFVCGDVNNDDAVNIVDITTLIAYLYQEGPEPTYLDAADVNNDDAVNIVDITTLIAFLYQEGPALNCGN